MLVLTAREGMPVEIPAGVDSRAVAAQIMKAVSSIPFPTFRISKGKLCAAEVVGTIQVNDLRINVLPKTDAAEDERDSTFLLNILRAAGYLRRAHTSLGSVRASMRDPLEIMISELINEINLALRGGLPRRYVEKREHTHALRGRIDFATLATRLPGSMTIPVMHTPLTAQNDLTNCLYWLARVLSLLTRNSSNRLDLQNLSKRIETHLGIHSFFSIPNFKGIKLSTSELRWERVLEIAKLLSVGNFVDPTNFGKTAAFTMLFPLQHVFERALRKILQETLQDAGVTVRHRGDSKFLLSADSNNEEILRLKPDYMFYRDEHLSAVADAKWKRLAETGRANSARREDFYQINAYLDNFDTGNAIVIMPRAPWMSPCWSCSYTIQHSSKRVHLVAVDIEKVVSHRVNTRIAAREELKQVLSLLM